MADKVERTERPQAQASSGNDASRALSHEATSNPNTISSDVKSQRSVVSNESTKLAQNQVLGNISLTDEQGARKQAANNGKQNADATAKPNPEAAASFNDRFSAAPTKPADTDRSDAIRIRPVDSTQAPASFADRFSAAKPATGYNENFSLYDSQAAKAPQSTEARAQDMAKNTTIGGDPNIADKPKFAKEIMHSAGKVVAASPEDRAKVFQNEAEKFSANHPEAMPSSFSGSMTYAMRQETGNKDLSVVTVGPHVQLLQGPEKQQNLVADQFVGFGKGLASTNPQLRLADSTAEKVDGVLKSDSLSSADMTKQVNEILKSASQADLATDTSKSSPQDKLAVFGDYVGSELSRRGVDVPSNNRRHSISVVPNGGNSYLQVDEVDTPGAKR